MIKHKFSNIHHLSTHVFSHEKSNRKSVLSVEWGFSKMSEKHPKSSLQIWFIRMAFSLLCATSGSNQYLSSHMTWTHGEKSGARPTILCIKAPSCFTSKQETISIHSKMGETKKTSKQNKITSAMFDGEWYVKVMMQFLYW